MRLYLNHVVISIYYSIKELDSIWNSHFEKGAVLRNVRRECKGYYLIKVYKFTCEVLYKCL